MHWAASHIDTLFFNFVSFETCQLIGMSSSHNILIHLNNCTIRAVSVHQRLHCAAWHFQYIEWHYKLFISWWHPVFASVFVFYFAARVWFYGAYSRGGILLQL